MDENINFQSYCWSLGTTSFRVKDLNFKNIYLHNSICYISSLTFGVYLIHDSEYLRYPIFDLFRFSSHYGSKYLALWILLIALGIFVFCLIIEAIRKIVIILIKHFISNKKSKLSFTFIIQLVDFYNLVLGTLMRKLLKLLRIIFQYHLLLFSDWMKTQMYLQLLMELIYHQI